MIGVVGTVGLLISPFGLLFRLQNLNSLNLRFLDL